MQVAEMAMLKSALVFASVLCLCCMINIDGALQEEEEVSLSEQVALLNKQVRVLLDRRQEDLEMIERDMRRTLAKNSDMNAMRKELDKLRHEVQQLRSGASSSAETETTTTLPQGNQDTNDHLTVKWLSGMVSELRTELSEMQYSQNASMALQRREFVDSEIKLLRTDLLNINKELGGVRTEQLKYEATLGQLFEEVNSVRDSERVTAALCADTSGQMKSMQKEWAAYRLRFAPSENVAQNTENSVSETKNKIHKTRHQHFLRKQIMLLKKTNQNITKQQALLQDKITALNEILNNVVQNKAHGKHGVIGSREVETRLRNVETRVENVEHGMNMVETIERNEVGNELIEDHNLMERIIKIEKQEKQNALSIFNISRQVSSFDRLHRSILELLESVETLENKVDKTVPDFRKEISQLEFNMAQTLSEIALMKEDQSNSMQSVKAMSVGISALRDKVELDHETLEQLNITLSLLQASNYIQNSKLHDHILKTETAQLSEGYTSLNSTTNIIQELEEVENEYHSIINKLPHDCSSVEGPSGLYLISPGAGEPVMASCHEGWTTVQRRRDGSVDFNRNWDEYSRGFGSASGEFWIGNRVLNRLTRDNCSSLKIDMIDIYGKSYYAEYEEFIVEGLSNGFRLHVSGYSGNSSDALDYQNRMEFSTVDNDRDISNTHCASNYEGGWWFSHCQHANLNGKYNLGLTWFDNSRNEWIAVATSEMKVKRKEGCEHH